MGYLFFLLCMICWMMYGCISCESDDTTMPPRHPPPTHTHTQTCAPDFLSFLSAAPSPSSPLLPPPLPSLRLEDPLRHQLRQGRLLALPDPDRLLLPLDVLDVPQQRLPLHVGGGAHHVSALPGPTRLNSHRRPRVALLHYVGLPSAFYFLLLLLFLPDRGSGHHHQREDERSPIQAL